MYKDIKDFENYAIDEKGNVLSKNRDSVNTLGHVHHIKERILKQQQTKSGYCQVSLMQDKKRTVKYVHILVAEAFLEKNNIKDVVNHMDGNKSNNHVENLEWCSYSNNNQHAYDSKLKKRGEDFYNAKLTEDKVREIRALNKDNYTYQQIGDMYGVSKATARDAMLYITWKHVK